ncbi:hypothetical protein BcDW1_5782 [Botrytis cinerea BcDW1]|uniref:Uncharacterized protein n=1 Tax=Botryotinia fuckeliana (strain BcDW1) TaxID=1290391 RepID=M7UP89_BOTF1|nr:hypothetical protein BcDW1_5782 [Botrytis cinerea BcDW1]
MYKLLGIRHVAPSHRPYYLCITHDEDNNNNDDDDDDNDDDDNDDDDDDITRNLKSSLLRKEMFDIDSNSNINLPNQPTYMKELNS